MRQNSLLHTSAIRNFAVLCLITIVISGCDRNVNDSFVIKVDKECGSQPKSDCVVSLKDVTEFTWDKMYLLGSWTTTDSITKTIGFRYEGDDVSDDHSRMLFTYKNKMVHEEDFESFEDRDHSVIYFANTVNKTPPYHTPSQTIFHIKKTKAKNGCKDCFDYTLIPVKKDIK